MVPTRAMTDVRPARVVCFHRDRCVFGCLFWPGPPRGRPPGNVPSLGNGGIRRPITPFGFGIFLERGWGAGFNPQELGREQDVERCEHQATQEHSCGLKSALHSETERGIYPAGTSALQARAREISNRVDCLTLLRTEVRAPFQNGARDLSRRNARATDTRPRNFKPC